MAYINREWTIHSEQHDRPVANCDYCPAYTDTWAYHNQLRSVLWGLVEKYPDRYTFVDYVSACEQAGVSAVWGYRPVSRLRISPL